MKYATFLPILLFLVFQSICFYDQAVYRLGFECFRKVKILPKCLSFRLFVMTLNISRLWIGMG